MIAHVAAAHEQRRALRTADYLGNGAIDGLFRAVAEATEEAVIESAEECPGECIFIEIE